MSRVENDFFEQLEKKGIKVSSSQREQINNRLKNILNYQPRVGVFGKTGVGKSSLCNALFGSEVCPISDVEACTRNTADVLIQMGNGAGITLVDVPGVGESTVRDEEYAALYAKLLPELDLVLWLIKADDRAMASDENFYKNIVKSHIQEGKPFFFVLNQVDKIEPFREWDEENHEPGPRQLQNITRKIKDVANNFDIAPSRVIPVSANEQYNLTTLVDEFVRALPASKQITVFRNVNQEFQSKSTGEHVKKSFAEVVGEVVSNVVGAAGSVVEKIVDRTADVLIKAIDKMGEKIGSILDNIPISRHGSGCFITSAVCRDSGLPDDCYELQAFRKFRDEWLVNKPYGKKDIRKYYLYAPTIVKCIDKEENSSEIYQMIRLEYLNKCLKLIEEENFEQCYLVYKQMVDELSGKYILWA